MDIVPDTVEDMRKRSSAMRWDRKKRKYVNANDLSSVKRRKNESGNFISLKAPKRDFYAEWREKTHQTIATEGMEDAGTTESAKRLVKSHYSTKHGGGEGAASTGGELRTPAEMAKLKEADKRKRILQMSKPERRKKLGDKANESRKKRIERLGIPRRNKLLRAELAQKGNVKSKFKKGGRPSGRR